MAIVKGVWVFNETITKIPVSEDVNFSVTLSDGSIIDYDLMFISNKNLGYKQAGQAGVTCAYYHSLSPNRWTNENWRTVDFGTTEQTVTDEFYTWLTANAVQQSSDPSEPETDTLYTVNGSSLTTVANAIRSKTETSGELIFPDGYVSAIEDISSVSDLSNAKDIAFGGNESGNKYVIEDETITPLFDQIQRVTKTEEALTFEEATASLLNVVPGGGLPNAEEAYFGTGDESNGKRLIEWTEGSGCNQMASGTIGWEFTVNETFGVVGFRGMVTEAGTYTFKIREQYEESAVAELQVNFEETYTWCEFKLSSTVNLLAGKTYAFTLYGNKMPCVGTLTSYTMNSKVTEINKVYIYGTDAYPTETTKSRPTINMLMGSAITESTPNEYKIQTQTLSDIADEVRRIGGVSGNITMAQILTTLQSIQLQDKSITPTAEVQTITPNDGYYGLSSVTVGAITEENEAVIEIINEKMEVVANDTY